MTCKHKSRKEFCWVSREVLPFIKRVVVDSTWFADHSILFAELDFTMRIPSTPVWRNPLPIDWAEEIPLPDFPIDDSDQFYHQFWKHFEEVSDHVLQSHQRHPLLKAQKGRGTTTEVTWNSASAPPAKRARKGEYQSEFVGENSSNKLRRHANFVGFRVCIIC